MKRTLCGCCLMVFLLMSAAAYPDLSELEVVDRVDLNRYLGKWYEIASYPAWFQKGCTASTAEYTMRSDGKIKIMNRCHKDHLDGPLKESVGKAEVVDDQTNAKLKVWFFWPFKGNYWIIDLDHDYRWAVVGEPKRKYLWILSRTPTIDKTLYQTILSRLPAKGYDSSKLRPTPQKSKSGFN
ncbi:MAG: lipocalin family protein [Desulfobacterales bacterium]